MDLLREPRGAEGGAACRPAHVHRVASFRLTLQLLWEEYRRSTLRLCYTVLRILQALRGQLEPSLRQTYRAGEKLFVDWAGQTIPVWDGPGGQSREALLFVGVLGASDYLFAEAFENRQ